jgi:hypothetical protein
MSSWPNVRIPKPRQGHGFDSFGIRTIRTGVFANNEGVPKNSHS